MPDFLNHRRRQPALHLPADVVLIIALFVAHTCLVLVWRDNALIQTLILDVGSALESGVLGIYLFVVAWKTKVVSKRLQSAWLCIGAAFFLIMLGNVFEAYHDLVTTSMLAQQFSNLIYDLVYPPVMVGLLLFPAYATTRLERVRLLVDSLIVMIAATLIVLIYLIKPLSDMAAYDPSQLLALLVAPVGDLALFCVAIATLASKPHTSLRKPLNLIAIAAIGMALGDVLFNFQAMIKGMNTPVFFAISFAASLACTALAATIQLRMISATGHLTPASIQFDDANQRRWTQLLYPVLISIGMVVLLAGWLFGEMSYSLQTPLRWFIDFGLAGLFLLVLVRQALSMIDAARLSSQQTRILETSRIFVASRNFADLQQLILRQLAQVVTFKAAALILLDSRDNVSFVRYAPDAAELPTSLIPRAELPEDGLNSSKPFLLFDVHKGPYLKLIQRVDPAFDAARLQTYSALAVPLKVMNGSIGLLLIYDSHADQYDDWHQRVVSAFASQAAAAIENMQLRTSAVNAAAEAERSKLARDLHDSVSQALFGIVMGVNSALVLQDKKHADVKAPLQYVLALADGALSEMKALIFELRPDTLMKEGLIAALQRQTDVLCRRHGIQTQLHALIAEPSVSPEVKEALYRIALEAVQNTIKHAGAKTVDITLYQRDGSIIMDVKDDGKGFDAQREFIGHLGLVSMRERAATIGGRVEISSKPNQGTLVRVLLAQGLGAESNALR